MDWVQCFCSFLFSEIFSVVDTTVGTIMAIATQKYDYATKISIAILCKLLIFSPTDSTFFRIYLNKCKIICQMSIDYRVERSMVFNETNGKTFK